MMIVDVHAHMDFDIFKDDLDELLEDFKRKQVKIVVSNGVDINSNRKTLELAKKYLLIKPALGIYPIHCLEMIEAGKQKEFDDEIAFIEEKIKSKECIAIGEVGIDYYKMEELNDGKKTIMKNCLTKFAGLAIKHDIPIIVHSRAAELETIELLEELGMKNKKVIMHCFSGRKHLVKRIRDNKWYFSIPCNILRSQQFQDIVLETPLDQIFTETDAPYMSPVPGERNDSRNIALSIKKIAELKKMDEQEVANIIYNNYQRVFM